MGDLVSICEGVGGVPISVVLDLPLQRLESGQLRVTVAFKDGPPKVFDTSCKLDGHGSPCRFCLSQAASTAFVCALGAEAAVQGYPVDAVFDVVCRLNGVPFLPDWEGVM